VIINPMTKFRPAHFDHPNPSSPSANPTADAPNFSPWRSFPALLRLGLTAALGLTADLATKQWAIKTIGNPDIINPLDPDTTLKPVVLIENYLQFNTIHNTGAVAGFAAGKTAFLILASLAALAFLLWLFAHSSPQQGLFHFGLGMLFAGALGNMYDRVFNHGKVIDFIEVNLYFWPANPWPTFNLADVLLCTGVGLLLLTLLSRSKYHSA